MYHAGSRRLSDGVFDAEALCQNRGKLVKAFESVAVP
jgi:hypothetical protein